MKKLLKRILIKLLVAEAKLVLKKYQPRVIVVAGDVGKTTTKDAIYEILRPHSNCRKSEKSFNSEIGLPLSILGAKSGWSSIRKWVQILFKGAMTIVRTQPYPEVLILELGDRKPGDSKYLADWLAPDTVVLTKIDDIPTHVEFFASIEGSRQEKVDILRAAKQKAFVIYGAADQNAEQIVTSAKRDDLRLRTYGQADTADMTIKSIDVVRQEHLYGTMITIDAHGNEQGIFVAEHLGQGIADAVSAGLAVAESEGVAPLESIKQFPNSPDFPRGRLRAIPGVKNSLIIDDTYNAGLASTLLALQTLKSIPHQTRRIALLADMLELGDHAQSAHELVGQAVPKHADILVVVGKLARIIADSARSAGMATDNIFTFSNSREAGKFVEQMIRSGDVVLVKGSQGLRMERAVQEMMLHPENREHILVRQEKEWQKR